MYVLIVTVKNRTQIEIADFEPSSENQPDRDALVIMLVFPASG